MSGMTDELKATMLGVNREASPSNLDAALATGEMLSAPDGCCSQLPWDSRNVVERLCPRDTH